jgi:hypothetical protein
VTIRSNGQHGHIVAIAILYRRVIAYGTDFKIVRITS